MLLHSCGFDRRPVRVGPIGLISSLLLRCYLIGRSIAGEFVSESDHLFIDFPRFPPNKRRMTSRLLLSVRFTLVCSVRPSRVCLALGNLVLRQFCSDVVAIIMSLFFYFEPSLLRQWRRASLLKFSTRFFFIYCCCPCGLCLARIGYGYRQVWAVERAGKSDSV